MTTPEERTFSIKFTAKLDPDSKDLLHIKAMLLDALSARAPLMDAEDLKLAEALLDEGV